VQAESLSVPTQHDSPSSRLGTEAWRSRVESWFWPESLHLQGDVQDAGSDTVLGLHMVHDLDGAQLPPPPQRLGEAPLHLPRRLQ